MAGCVVARDVASTGLRCVVLERDASVGGVWQNNDYSGLRLHGLAAPYRAWSLAPPWQRRSEENLYRPTRGEILDYVARLVDHVEIDVKTSCEYVEHDAFFIGDGSEMEESRRYTVTFQNMSTGKTQAIVSRVIVFATGVVSTLGGQAILPIDVSQITNGAKVLHSSQMASIDEDTLDEVENIYVVGSSKASIDLLGHFLKNEHLVDKTKWIHRGHTIFTRRESMEGWMISPNPIFQRTRCLLFHTASWMFFHQMFGPVVLGMSASPDFFRMGAILARIPYRGGVENSAVLEGVESVFGPSQLLLKRKTASNGNAESMLVKPAGILEFHAEDGSMVHVTGNDLVIFCTGQRRDHNNFQLESHLNSSGVFTVHQYCQIPPVCAVLTVGLIISYLDRGGHDTIYTSGHLTKQLIRIRRRLDHAKDNSSWTLALSYLGGMFALVQPSLTPKIIGDLGFDYRWQREWFGKDLDVRLDLLPLVTMPTTCC